MSDDSDKYLATQFPSLLDDMFRVSFFSKYRRRPNKIETADNNWIQRIGLEDRSNVLQIEINDVTI